jgi:arginase
MKFNVLGACSGLGQKHAGLDLTPDLIRENGFLNVLENSGYKFTDLGNIKPSGDGVWPLLIKIKAKVFENVALNQILFNLGGDHSIAMGTVGGTLEKFPETRLVWVDAHGDLNTPASSLTGNLHGMPLAALLGLFKTNLELAKLKSENLILIGIRDLDDFEKELINTLKLEVIFANEINSDPLSALFKISKWLNQKSTPIHLSFDIDSVDPTIAPATGLRVAGGIDKTFTQNLIHQLAETKKVIAVDLVELNAFQSETKSEVQSTVDIFVDILKTFILVNIAEKNKTCFQKV